MFNKEDVFDTNRIFLQGPSPKAGVEIPVQSNTTGVVKMFKLDEEATHDFAVSAEWWDGEEAHYILRCVDNPDVTLEVFNTPYNPMEDFEGVTFSFNTCIGCGRAADTNNLCPRCDANDKRDIDWYNEVSANTHS
jgi:hypothetical protein